MNDRPNSLPAFPHTELKTTFDGRGYPLFGRGMSLRDYFAGQALMGFVSDERFSTEDVAVMAYDYADAMIAERDK